jgi:hypothetical protein
MTAITSVQRAIWNSEPDSKFHEIYSRWAPPLEALGDAAPLPAQAAGETTELYRKRCIEIGAKHSQRWPRLDASRFAGGPSLDQLETQILEDVQKAVYDPSTVPAGTLREVVQTDRTNRRITRFVGDPENCWGAFKMPIKRILGIAGERR